MSNPTTADIWQTLSKINVEEHIEVIKTKNGKELRYLSWAWAWGTLMENYPDATYEFLEPETHANGSMTVYCQVTINKTTRLMWLPILDFANNAITNPNAAQINKAKMRCLVKCLAMFGLGHYIYAGEDFPDEKQELSNGVKQEAPKLITQTQVDSLYDALEESDSDMQKFLESYKKNSIEEFTEDEYINALQKIAYKMGKANAGI